MSRLDRVAETTKLSRLLEVPEAELEYLHKLGSDSMRVLREQINAALFDDTRTMLLRVAAASKLLPVSAIAKIGEKLFGAMLCARVTGLLPAERALDASVRLPDAFLADVAVQIDPRSAGEVIGRMPAVRVLSVAKLLLQRRDYVTLGRFVDYLSQATLKTVIAGIDDDAGLLHAAFYVENKATLNDIAGVLPLTRLRKIVALAGAEGSNLWAEALSLINHVDASWQTRIGDLAAELDETVLLRMLRTAQQQNLWEALLPVIAAMSPVSRQKLLRLPALADVEVLSSIIEATDRAQLWPQLLPLVTQMSKDARHAAAACVEKLNPEILQRLLVAVQGSDLWSELLDLLELMDASERSNIARLIGLQDEALLTPLLKHTHVRRLWPRMMPLFAVMPKAQLEALRRLALKLDLEWPV